MVDLTMLADLIDAGTKMFDYWNDHFFSYLIEKSPQFRAGANQIRHFMLMNLYVIDMSENTFTSSPELLLIQKTTITMNLNTFTTTEMRFDYLNFYQSTVTMNENTWNDFEG